MDTRPEEVHQLVNQIDSNNAQVLNAVNQQVDCDITMLFYRLAINARKREMRKELAQDFKEILSL